MCYLYHAKIGNINMITSIFSKSRPINYIIICILLSVFYILKNLNALQADTQLLALGGKVILGAFLILSVLWVQFINYRNNLCKDSMFAPYLFVIMMVLFSSVFVNTDIIIANFFILLSCRRLISMQSMIHTKQKLFDASVWIFVATLFHFWSILFLILVFITIIFHVSSDYRNWFIPFIAAFIVSMIVVFVSMVTRMDIILQLMESARISLNFTYFENNYQRIALAVFAAVASLFFGTQLLNIASKPLNVQSTYKKIIFIFIISVGIYVISDEKNNSFLAFSFFPLSIFGSNMIENLDNKWIQEAVLWVLTLIAVAIFIVNL